MQPALRRRKADCLKTDIAYENMKSAHRSWLHMWPEIITIHGLKEHEMKKLLIGLDLFCR